MATREDMMDWIVVCLNSRGGEAGLKMFPNIFGTTMNLNSRHLETHSIRGSMMLGGLPKNSEIMEY